MRDKHATIIRDGILSARNVLAGGGNWVTRYRRRTDTQLWFRAYWRTLQHTTHARRAARGLRNFGWRG